MTRSPSISSLLASATALGLLLPVAASAEWSYRGDISLQLQAFTDSAQHSATQSANSSFSGNAEFNRAIGENGDITISPFFRVDQHDDQRTHVDLRELLYRHSFETLEISAGLGKVFWGVAESSNIVDIINQRDAVEGLDAENKLGQPMVNLLLLPDWGEINLYVLPGFRERTFAGKDGRPRAPFVIDTDNAEYEDSSKASHVDFAARINGATNEWDWGISAFSGTGREPLIGVPSLRPFYPQISQFGFDVQGTFDSWLLKLESIYQSGKTIDNHSRFVTGYEYSFYGIADSAIDLGIVHEFLYDDRQQRSGNAFQNDMLLGLRFAFNDEQSTDALVGVIKDLDGGATILTAEANRRIGESFKFTFEAIVWADANNDLILNSFQQEDYVLLELGYFF